MTLYGPHGVITDLPYFFLGTNSKTSIAHGAIMVLGAIAITQLRAGNGQITGRWKPVKWTSFQDRECEISPPLVTVDIWPMIYYDWPTVTNSPLYCRVLAPARGSSIEAPLAAPTTPGRRRPRVHGPHVVRAHGRGSGWPAPGSNTPALFKGCLDRQANPALLI